MQRSHTPSMAALVGVALALTVRATHAQSVAQPDARPTVAVLYFNNGALVRHRDYDPLSKGIADMLITELSANSGIRVVERDQLQKLLEEQNLSRTDRVDKETAVRIGKVLGAHHMIFGGFVIDPKERMRLDARAVNVETSQVEHVETVSDKGDNLLAMISVLAGKLNKGLKLPPMPARARPAGDGQNRLGRLQALTLYSRALEEEDRGNREQAVALYRAALVKFPEYEPAQKRLARLEKPA